MAGEILYLDASALVKLIKVERESAALAVEVEGWTTSVTSIVGAIEARRAAGRSNVPAADLENALARVTLLELDEGIRELAATIEPPALRTLDAIHLATAIALEDDLGAIACYDERLATAAKAEGIAVVSPS